MSLVLYLLMCLSFFVVVRGTESEPVRFYSLPSVQDRTYSKLGDINIGALIITQNSGARDCTKSVKKTSYTIETTEAIAFAVDYVNRSPDILPNVTLGFVVLGVCKSHGPILTTSMLFFPQNKRVSPDTNDSLGFQDEALSDDGSPWVGFDVIGAVSTGWSTYTRPVASLYAVADVPIVGPTETTNELSSKKNYPTFYRITPPEKYQFDALLKFIKSNGWSYISIVYSDCGCWIVDTLKKIDNYGICVAGMNYMNSRTDPDDVVAKLKMNSKARVVILFISSESFTGILQSIVKQNLVGHFIWIGTNLFDSYSGTDTSDLANDPAIGTFYFDVYSKPVPDFFTHLRNLNVTETENPWLRPSWEYMFQCSIDEGTCDPDINLVETDKYRSYKGTPLRMDAVLTLAHAAHDLLMDRCPDARGKEARACITSKRYQDYLRAVNFNGLVAPIKFDKNQDNKGMYSIKQIVYDYPAYGKGPNTNITNKIIYGKEIGVYHIPTLSFKYHENNISWSHINVLERIVPWSPGSSLLLDIPESVCSRPCLPGEYKDVQEVSCCWECRTCRENERFIDGNTSCEACPSFTWPDPASGRTTCTDLPLTYSTIPDTIPIIFTSVALIALLVTVAISIAYFVFRNERVIKASSKELSVIQLVAIFVGYSTVVLFQTAPSDTMCAAIFFLFCMSFAMLYCPLLAKASRIFRIFKSGTKNERPSFISPQSQLIFSSCLIAVQVGLCVATYILYSPKAHRIQPVVTEKLVELSCDLTLPGLASFLGYNIVLVIVCSVFAFLTRTLPDNFNESKFISMCVSTTLLIWLAFIPTYFTASREFVRVFLLSVALVLNHTVALIFLFVPKIYAVVYLPASDGPVTKK